MHIWRQEAKGRFTKAEQSSLALVKSGEGFPILKMAMGVIESRVILGSTIYKSIAFGHGLRSKSSFDVAGRLHVAKGE